MIEILKKLIKKVSIKIWSFNFFELLSKFYLWYFKGIKDSRELDQEYRVIYVNNVKPDDYTGEEPLDYATNEIVTSKVNTVSHKFFFFFWLFVYLQTIIIKVHSVELLAEKLLRTISSSCQFLFSCYHYYYGKIFNIFVFFSFFNCVKILIFVWQKI